MNYYKYVLLIVFSTLSTVINADDITIDFEGLKNLEKVQNFYNGGQGSLGSSGPDYGISFNGESLAILDADEGGDGNFAKEKAPGHTIGFFLDSNKIIMNVEDGFTGGFSFWYTSISNSGDVIVYPNLNAQGNAIESLHLNALGSTSNGGDPNGTFNRWEQKSITFDGTAKSIVFQGVANQIGFDLITLSSCPPSTNFDITLCLDQIIHTPKSKIADTFSIYFKDIKGEEDMVSKICDNFFFKVEKNASSSDSRGAEQVTCHPPVDNKFSVDFKIKSSGNETYFENYNVYICKKDNKTNCKPIENIEEFSVYGTKYDVTKDAFSFINGDWNAFMFKGGSKPCYIFLNCDTKQSESIGQMRELVNSFKTFVPESQKDDLEQELIGYYETDNTRKFGGICHGLALSSIAYYNNFVQNSSWGDDLKPHLSEEKITNIFHSHWEDKASESAKPFVKDPYNYKNGVTNIDDVFHSLGKINYYFISQTFFSIGPGEKDWVGTYKRQSFSNITEMSAFHEGNLIKGNVSNFVFRIKKTFFSFPYRESGHSIVAVQLIEYNDINSYSLHDNNFKDQLVTMKFDKNETKFEKAGFIYDTNINKEENKYINTGHTFYKFSTYINDTLFVYGKGQQTKVAKETQQSVVAKDSSVNEYYSYNFVDHSEITIVGGKLLEIINSQTQEKIILSPILGTLEEDKAYLRDNLLVTKFYLPKDAVYQIKLQKYIQYPDFEIFAKIPNTIGEVEIINYEKVYIDKDDSTLATLLIGNGNTDKDIKREGGSNLPPTYNETFDIAITPVTQTNAIVLPTGISLHWTNPNNPNFKEVVVLRKKDERSENITDGIEIYRGKEDQYIDTTSSSNAKYHYSFYAVAQDGSISEVEYIFVDTFRYTLYGTISDINGSKINGSKVVLWNFNKTSIIGESSSDKNGLFSFNDLINGAYHLVFSDDFYTFSSEELKVNIQDKSLQVNNDAIGQSLLAVNVNPVFKVGNTETISWDGKHIDDSQAIDIELYSRQSWKTIATSIPFSNYSVDYTATNPEDNAKIKIVLNSDSSVFAEKEIVILAGDVEPPVDNIPGDFDSDDDVDKDDLIILRGRFGTKSTGSNDPSDLNNDGVINVLDYRKTIRLCTRPRCST